MIVLEIVAATTILIVVAVLIGELVAWLLKR